MVDTYTDIFDRVTKRIPYFNIRFHEQGFKLVHLGQSNVVDASIKLSQVSHQILSHLVNGFSLTQLWISLMVLRVRLFLSWVWLWVF